MTVFALWFYNKSGAVAQAKMSGPTIKVLENTIDELERDWGTWQVAWGELNRLQKIQSGGELETFSDAKQSLRCRRRTGLAWHRQ